MKSGDVLAVGLVGAALLAVLVCGGLVALPHLVTPAYRPARVECPTYVDGIKTAQMAHDAAFDTFVAVPVPVPRPVSDVDGEKLPWPTGSDFDTLGWAPDGPVSGTYWVEVVDREFIVHGVCDQDGDGVAGHYVATKTTNARSVGPENAY